MPSHNYPRILKETGLILLFAVLAGLVTNAARKDGISLSRPSVQHETAGRISASGIPLLPLKEVIPAWKQEGTIIIDAREPGFYKLGHIPGALSLPLSQFDSLFPSLRSRLQSARRLIVYCSGAGCQTSRKVAERCLNKFQKVGIFEGGIEAWKSAGMPLEKTE